MASSSPLHSPKPLPASSPPPPPHPDHPNCIQSMFCTVKSSNWLQRLRSSRGFPESDHIDLDHFLSTSQQSIDPTNSALTRKKTLITHDNLVVEELDNSEAVQGRDLINNVLSELFYMGDFEEKSSITRKKSCRKQQCPRICVVSTDSDVVQDVADRNERLCTQSLLPLTLSSRHKVNQVIECVGEEEEKGNCDLSAYSQTEVTVIDTSVPCWKFEKMLYRKKNVWKIGDKKGKGLMIGDRKKRKERVNENGDLQKKKLKKKMKLCDSSKYSDQDEKKRDDCSQLQEKSFSKKQGDEASSVILIRSIPTTNKKNVSVISNSSVKSLQR